MTSTPRTRSIRRLRPATSLALFAVSLTLVAACSSSGATAVASGDVVLFDDSRVHDIEVSFDQDEYEAMVETYASSGDKDWIEGRVTIDGTTFENVGLRLKGNSSLRGLARDAGGAASPAGGPAGGPGGSLSADEPESLPWLIRLDKYVDGQDYQGYTSLVVRANNSETALNEAVALELIGLAGEPTQESIATRFSVNGGNEVLRLAIENPDDTWEDDNFDSDGVLYKAESTGDYSYRGDDPESYDEVFDQETDTDNENLAPLIEFLDFVNNADDATFADELDEYLEVEAFARYLALQELVANFDDIDGPGNNSYLRYDADTGRITIVTWDLNLAFGGFGRMDPEMGGTRGGFPAGPGGDIVIRPGEEPPDVPEGGFPGGNGPLGGSFGRGNILVERFMADTGFAALYESSLSELTELLYDSGTAAEVLARRAGVLEAQASDLVDPATIHQEAATIEQYFR